jgi:hypothetical protein
MEKIKHREENQEPKEEECNSKHDFPGDNMIEE